MSTAPAILFSPPPGKDLIPFQEEGIIAAYETLTSHPAKAVSVLYDMGLGKSVISMALAGLLFEAGLIDHVLVVAEANKVRDWAEDDFPTWTDLSVKRYAGPPAKRAEIRQDLPQVLVMTYETGRNDIAVFKHTKKAQGRAITGPGPLAEALKDRRVLVIFDEITKLKGRTSRGHLAWDYLVNRWLRRRAKSDALAVGLTGTPIESSPEDHYNANRLLAPLLAPKVADFEEAYVKRVNDWGKVTAWKNLDPGDCEPGVVPLSRVFSEITLRKRKTDPDVLGWFPAKVENPSRFITLTPKQRAFYDDVVAALEPEDDEDPNAIQSALTLLRQIAGAPAALLHSQGYMAREIVGLVGERTIKGLGSAKEDALVEWMEEAGDQQVVVFTFFGQSVLPLLHERLRAEGYAVSINHGQMNTEERQTSQARFKAGQTQIFLSSDAGARGLNLGMGSALLHYELPLLYATYGQRSDRIHRADSVHPSVTVDSLIAIDTVEEAIFDLVMKRNVWSDKVIDEGAKGTSDGMDASMRKTLWRAARRTQAARRVPA